MSDFFKKILQAPKGNRARMQSSMMRKRGVQLHQKLIDPNERGRRQATKRVSHQTVRYCLLLLLLKRLWNLVYDHVHVAVFYFYKFV